MILVDTSVWVSHLREGNTGLQKLLNEGDVLCHDFVIGELACGNLRNRAEILALLRTLPRATEADHEEVLEFIERNHLMSKGLGWVDAHLMASAFLTGVRIWTLDNKMAEVSESLGIAV